MPRIPFFPPNQRLTSLSVVSRNVVIWLHPIKLNRNRDLFCLWKCWSKPLKSMWHCLIRQFYLSPYSLSCVQFIPKPFANKQTPCSQHSSPCHVQWQKQVLHPGGPANTRGWSRPTVVRPGQECTRTDMIPLTPRNLLPTSLHETDNKQYTDCFKRQTGRAWIHGWANCYCETIN